MDAHISVIASAAVTIWTVFHHQSLENLLMSSFDYNYGITFIIYHYSCRLRLQYYNIILKLIQ